MGKSRKVMGVSSSSEPAIMEAGAKAVLWTDPIAEGRLRFRESAPMYGYSRSDINEIN
jgi:hypothetical protein